MFYTYILLLSNRKHYTGLTNNIDRRMSEHQSGKSISTRRYLPAKLIYTKTVATRQEARRLEVKIKKMGAMRYLNKLRYSPGAV